MARKVPPPLPVETKKQTTEEKPLSKINPVMAAPTKSQSRICPRDLLKNSQSAFIFAEIIRPLDSV